MKKFLGYADQFVKQSDWKDLAMIKFCLCAFGILIGLTASKKMKKPLGFISVLIFIPTYILLILKYIKIVKDTNN